MLEVDTSINSNASTDHISESFELYKKEAEHKIDLLKDLLRKAKMSIEKSKGDVLQKVNFAKKK